MVPVAAPDRNPARKTTLYNTTSMVGTALFFMGAVGGAAFMVSAYLMAEPPAYMVLFLVPFVALVAAGVVLVPWGLLRSRRRRRQGLETRPPLVVIDLFRFNHFLAVNLVLVGLAVLGVVGFATLTQSFQVMETNTFCGQLCHTVMEPEYTAYQYSSHARVKCVECHIGAGADWYVRSKLSGVRQIVAVAANSFPRPIPTPIEDLRPARETCEQCHWPRKFIGFKESIRTYFLSDEENTAHHIRMLIKTGGEESNLMKGVGIHYHMLLSNTVEYIARDEGRQDIAWVRITDGQGRVKEYDDRYDPLQPSQRVSREVRQMDCMDCHNRPSHRFPSPMKIVNQALVVGQLDRSLPYIKVEAVRVLSEEYETTAEAMTGIREELLGFYEEEYPEVAAGRRGTLERSIATVQDLFRRTTFPEMKARWSAYPDNLGHRDWPGCFRCHNDRLTSGAGETIFTTCNRCHLILAQGGDVTRMEVDLEEGLPFEHPNSDETIEEFTLCIDCHDGGYTVYD